MVGECSREIELLCCHQLGQRGKSSPAGNSKERCAVAQWAPAVSVACVAPRDKTQQACSQRQSLAAATARLANVLRRPYAATTPLPKIRVAAEVGSIIVSSRSLAPLVLTSISSVFPGSRGLRGPCP